MSHNNVTDSAERFSASHSSNGSVSLSEPESGYLNGPMRDRLISSADGISREESNWAGLEDPQAKTPNLSVTLCSRITIGAFVETKFIPEYVAFKRSSGQAFYLAMLKHVLIPEEVDCLFGANPEKHHKRLKSIPDWPYLSNIRFCDVQPDDIYRLLSAALVRGYSTQTVKHIRNVISAIFSHAKQEHYFIGDNPVRLVKPPKLRRQNVVELTPTQVIGAVRIMRYPEREMTLIGVFTGMSPAEISGLQWGHVNLADEEVSENGIRIPPRTICVRKRWYRGKSESVQENCLRDLPIAPPLLGILEQIRRRSHSTAPEDFVLISSIGTPIDQNNIVSRRLRPIAMQLGLPSLSWQTIRRKHEVLAEELDKEFGFSALIIPRRMVTVIVEDGARTAQALQLSSI